MTAFHMARTSTVKQLHKAAEGLADGLARGAQAGFHGVKMCSAEIDAVLWPGFGRQCFTRADHGFACPLALEDQERTTSW
jgi:hypothetical protein